MVTKWLFLDVAVGLLAVAGAVYVALSIEPDPNEKSKRFFDKAVVYLMAVEGGYANHPKDTGGETNFGISKKAFPKVDIKNLTPYKAKKLYYSHYWQPCYHPTMSYTIAVITFDGCVHLGVAEGIRQLQKALRVSPDGVMGAATARAISRQDPMAVALRMLNMREESYRQLPQYKTFRRAWKSRLFQLAFNAS